MGILGLFGFKKAATFDSEDVKIAEISKNVSLRDGALQKNAHYVARGVSKAKFVLKGPQSKEMSHWLYMLNVSPNPNQTASKFLAEIAKTLIVEGSVLIVVKNKQLYIVDSYTKSEARLEGHLYHVTQIQGITVDETFKSEDVIFLENENEGLKKFTEELWKDYGELLGRLINRQKTANQIRFTLTLPKDRLRERAQELADGVVIGKSGDGKAKPEKSTGQRFLDRLVGRIKQDPVVPIPVNKDSSYQEYSNRYSSKASFVDDIKQTKYQFTDEVAEMLGLPTALIHGETADNQKNLEQAIEVVFEPLVQKIVDGFQKAIFSEADYLAGNYLKATGLHKRDLFDVATPADKLIAAGIATADEIREEIGLLPLPNGLGQKLYITKNYEALGEKGGKDDESTVD